MTRSDGGAGVVRFAGLPGGTDGVRDVEIWLPHYERIELVALRADAPLGMSPEASPWERVPPMVPRCWTDGSPRSPAV